MANLSNLKNANIHLIQESDKLNKTSIGFLNQRQNLKGSKTNQKQIQEISLEREKQQKQMRISSYDKRSHLLNRSNDGEKQSIVSGRATEFTLDSRNYMASMSLYSGLEPRDQMAFQLVQIRKRIKQLALTLREIDTEYEKALKTLYLTLKVNILPSRDSITKQKDLRPHLNQSQAGFRREEANLQLSLADLDVSSQSVQNLQPKIYNANKQSNLMMIQDEQPYLQQKQELSSIKGRHLKTIDALKRSQSLAHKDSVKTTERENSIEGVRKSFYSSLSMKEENIAKNNTCKIKDMIYTCGEYETGEESQLINRNYRRNTIDYPDHFKDPKTDLLSQQTIDGISVLRQEWRIKSKSPQMQKLLRQPEGDCINGNEWNGDGRILGQKDHHHHSKFMNSLIQNSKEELEEIASLMKEIHLAGVDFRLLNKLRVMFLQRDRDETGKLSVEQFRQILSDVTIKSPWSSQLVEKLINHVLSKESAGEKEKGLQVVDFPRFNRLVDIYHYFPSMKRNKGKNYSEEVYYILSSNKASNFGEAKLETSHLVKLMDTLWDRVTSKFYKLAQAFSYFDLNQNSRISFNEFVVGTEGLNCKFTEYDAKEIFKYLDKNGDGYIDYKEFCNLTEEKRKNIDPFEPLHSSEAQESSSSTLYSSTQMKGGQDENEIFQRKRHLFDPQHYLGKNQNQVAQQSEEIQECVSKQQALYKQKKLNQQFLQSTIQQQRSLIEEKAASRLNNSRTQKTQDRDKQYRETLEKSAYGNPLYKSFQDKTTLLAYQNQESVAQTQKVQNLRQTQTLLPLARPLATIQSMDEKSRQSGSQSFGARISRDPENIKTLVNFGYQHNYLDRAQNEQSRLEIEREALRLRWKNQKQNDMSTFVERINRKRQSLLGNLHGFDQYLHSSQYQSKSKGAESRNFDQSHQIRERYYSTAHGFNRASSQISQENSNNKINISLSKNSKLVPVKELYVSKKKGLAGSNISQQEGDIVALKDQSILRKSNGTKSVLSQASSITNVTGVSTKAHSIKLQPQNLQNDFGETIDEIPFNIRSKDIQLPNPLREK